MTAGRWPSLCLVQLALKPGRKIQPLLSTPLAYVT